MKTKNVPKLPEISEEALEALKKGVQDKRPISELQELGVSQKLINLLESYKITDISILLNHKKENLLTIPNFGHKQLVCLFDALSKYHDLNEI